MKDLTIYIPTRSRAHLQRTLSRLPPELQKITRLVVDNGCVSEYARWSDTGCGFVETPKKVKGIAPIRQYIVENSRTRYLIMLDDDLFFQKKRPDGRITNSTEKEVRDCFQTVYGWLKKDGFAHVGVWPRALGFHYTEPFFDNKRMMHFLGYDTKQVAKSRASFTKGIKDPQTYSMDDFHMTLQLIESGHANRVSLLYRTSPSPSNSKGGASTWRNLETQNKSALEMKRLHKDFVTVKEKTQWLGMEGTRLDVVINWRRAAKAGGLS